MLPWGCIKKAHELEKELKKESKVSKQVNLLEIDNIQNLLDSFSNEDTIIIVGGDGTLYHIVNQIQGYDITNKVIMLAKAGTGNDFYRDVKHLAKDGFVRIDKFLQKTPSVEFLNKTNHFNNSCGIGVDGDICNRVNLSKKKSAVHYLLNCLKAVLNFNRFTLNAKIDGKDYEFKNTWFATVMEGKYFGGGMKVAPDQDRTSDELTMVVVHNVCVFLLIFILPTIYIGKHVKVKKYVKVFKCKNVEIKTSSPQYVEIDGDIVPNIEYLKVNK